MFQRKTIDFTLKKNTNYIEKISSKSELFITLDFLKIYKEQTSLKKISFNYLPTYQKSMKVCLKSVCEKSGPYANLNWVGLTFLWGTQVKN